MRTLGCVLLQYSKEHGGAFPATLSEANPWLTAEDMQCGGTPPNPGSSTYTYWGAGLRTPCNSRAVLLTESPDNHARAGVNVLLADGTVRELTRREAVALLAELKAGHNPPSWLPPPPQP
jgi:hypothetical protein